MLPDDELNPVKQRTLRLKWPPTHVDVESRAHAGSGGAGARFRARLATLLHALGGRALFATGLATPLFRPRQYRQSLIRRSDFRKFDGMLRMVLDAPAAAIPPLLAFLEQERARGALHYGVHRAPSAIMTCIVFSLQDDSHLHFIDGSDGGYAMAATQYKGQLKETPVADSRLKVSDSGPRPSDLEPTSGPGFSEP
jgi:hypothetical protein